MGLAAPPPATCTCTCTRARSRVTVTELLSRHPSLHSIILLHYLWVPAAGCSDPRAVLWVFDNSSRKPALVWPAPSPAPMPGPLHHAACLFAWLPLHLLREAPSLRIALPNRAEAGIFCSALLPCCPAARYSRPIKSLAIVLVKSCAGLYVRCNSSRGQYFRTKASPVAFSPVSID